MSGLNSSGNNPTVWIERDDLLLPSTAPSYPKLTEDITTEIVIVGAGIAGLQIAYELLNAGKKNVVILEDGKVGSGETGRTTGHLSVDNEYNDFVSLHGTKVTADIAAAQQTAIERLSEIVQKHNIECDFQRLPGYMFQGLPPSSKDYESKTLHELYDAAKDTGAISVELVDDAQIKGFTSGQAIKFNNQATFHPTKYVRALAGVINEMGGKIFEQTRMLSSEEKGEGVVSVKMVDGREVRAEKLVMATNVPLQKLVVIDRIEAYRSYAIALQIPTDSISSSGEQALWWDMADPYHYIRITPSKTPGQSLLVVGGEDEKIGQHDDYQERYRKLEEWTRERWTQAGEVEYKWSGQISETTDGIAIIGLNPGTKNTYIHTGDNGDGLTYAAVGGLILSSLLTGKDHPWATTFSPSREISHKSGLLSSIKVLPDLIKENLSDQVYFTKWLTTCTKTMADIEDLVPGHGEVVRDGMKAVAVYKEEGGGLRKMTAVCPHLKGIVAWNSDEKSWDCPIHGSRFTCKGDVVNGPAKIGLEPVN